MTTADHAGTDFSCDVAVPRAVEQVARQVEIAEGAAAVLTNLGRSQDSKHLHVHVTSGAPLRADPACRAGPDGAVLASLP